MSNDLQEQELFNVLKNSLYVGASPDSIKMVLSYCKAAKLDPMQKPVHIVPMYCSTGNKTKDGKDIKAMRDVIMPGIGLYRIQASRTEQLAGVSEPEFGDIITEKLGTIEFSYPAWCKVTVKRLMSNGSVAEFTSKEFWKENYATKSRDDKAPNAMWERRPYGQLAKCAEAQALRKAFHELGSQVTAEEMEGKEIDITPTDEVPKLPEQETFPEYPADNFAVNFNEWKLRIQAGKQTPDSVINTISTKYTLTPEQITQIKEIK